MFFSGIVVVAAAVVDKIAESAWLVAVVVGHIDTVADYIGIVVGIEVGTEAEVGIVVVGIVRIVEVGVDIVVEGHYWSYELEVWEIASI